MPRIRKTLEPITISTGHRIIMRRPHTIPRVQLAKDLPTIMGLIFRREVGEDVVVPVAEIEAAIDFLAAHVTRVDDGPEDVLPLEGAEEAREYFETSGIWTIVHTLEGMFVRLTLLDQGKTYAQFQEEWEADHASPPPPHEEE